MKRTGSSQWKQNNEGSERKTCHKPDIEIASAEMSESLDLDNLKEEDPRVRFSSKRSPMPGVECYKSIEMYRKHG